MNEFEQKVMEIKINGFTVIENVLNSDEVQEMREALIECESKFGTETKHRGSASHVANLVPQNKVFFKCIDHPKVLPYLEEIMGKQLILGSLNSRIVRPGDGKQGLHGDVPLELHRHLNSPVMMNTVWALSDYTSENGATRVVPGSHTLGLGQPPEGFDVQFEHQAICPAGSVIVFNGQLWHGGGENKSNGDRYAMFGHYRVAPWMRFQVDPHFNFPEENFKLLNDRQKALLRMSNGINSHHGQDMVHTNH